MGLRKYKAKRHFDKTKEPAGKKKSKSKGKTKLLTFVVQKHAARRLHYDFRLELDGVLKSWAVPKGPSLDPSVKRLAIQVEDHPLEYGSFEGLIPKGEYGAGEVIVWDNGTYEVEGDKDIKEQEKIIRAQMKRGDFKFTLHGKKLKGKFVLVQLSKDPSGKQWLLIKKKDDEESKEDITKEGGSVLSNKKIIEPELGPKTAMPRHIKPMLAYLVDEPFDRKEWIFEIKWDGYRAISEIIKKKVQIYSRNMISFKDKFPTVVKDLEKIKDDVVLDGEVVFLDKEGHSNFQLLQNYLRSDETKGTLKYCVFDLLYYKGHDLRARPLLERKEILKKIVDKISPSNIIYSDHVNEIGTKFYKEAQKQNLEGIMAKDGSSSYVSKRSKSWLKIKTHLRQEVVIVGFTQPKGSRKNFGALIVAVYKKGVLTYAGHVGGGFDERTLKDISARLKPLITDKSPFKKVPKTNTPVTWMKPKLVCEVSFQEWTKEGIMRQPIFQGMRIDKSPKTISKEQPIDVKETVGSSNKTEKKKTAPKKGEITSKTQKGSNTVLEEVITHPDKIYWPKEGYTKQDLLEYYQAIAPYILPHLKDRPITLHRYPDGIEGGDFYQKEAPKFIPAYIQTYDYQHTGKKAKTHYMLIQDLKSLLYVANLGCIEIHPFLSRYVNVEYPDFLVLDLDPEALTFSSIIEVAQEINRFFKALKLPSVCKTSGKRGFHIYIPLAAQYDYDVVEDFAKLLASILHEKIPDITSIRRLPEKRQRKVYIDYLQNGRTKSVAAPYSVRPIEGAMVSTPLDWSEVKKGLDPHDFTIKTVVKRVEKKGDLFKAALGKGININAIIKKLEKI